MREYVDIVFAGGVADGRIYGVLKGTPRVSVPVRPELPSHGFYGDLPDPRSRGYVIDNYYVNWRERTAYYIGR